MIKKFNLKNEFIVLLAAFTLILITSCNAQEKPSNNKKGTYSNVKVTFVELGSVKCVPCMQMQPIMKSVEKKYGEQIKVVFHDVWTDEGRKYAEIYKIQLIPTQVFLDEKGKEIFRHVGFFPEAEIDKFLQEQGLNILN